MTESLNLACDMLSTYGGRDKVSSSVKRKKLILVKVASLLLVIKVDQFTKYLLSLCIRYRFIYNLEVILLRTYQKIARVALKTYF